MQVDADIINIKGVGKKTSENLNKCGIYTILDLLLYFPRSYEKIHNVRSIHESYDGEKVIIDCTVSKVLRDIRTQTRKTITTIVFYDGSNFFYGKWFNQPYIKNKYDISSKYTIIGKISIKGKIIEILNPVIVNSKKDIKKDMVCPIYPLKNKITNNMIRKIINEVLENIIISENLPKWIIDKYKFCSLDSAVRQIHNPTSIDKLECAKNRLKFQELFTYSLKILILKEYLKKNNKGISFKTVPELKDLFAKLPFSLTNAQKKVISEILSDEKKSCSMNRLIQGDVGSGKTIVAFISMFNVVKNGYQAALMAPTEILASQHYAGALKLFKNFNINIKLLTGNTTAVYKKVIKDGIENGDIDIIIGTHALIQDDVKFKNLGIVVTDEQHRFGVAQRNRLLNKGRSVDLLVMTATPIPRTLSLYLYGDLNISVIDELPPGRKKITTTFIRKEQSFQAYRFALGQIKKGRQVYIVCPLIEENGNTDLNSIEDEFKSLKKNFFKNVNIAILHGKMSASDKHDIMGRFKSGEIKVLISTTVIEVGVNIPNATVMIIENAERFGLAQLHQLRGRVGRGSEKSFCILIANVRNETVKKRMEIMQKSTDGFYISEQDLKIRGSGQVFGINQHGDNGLILSNVIDDIRILKCANSEAQKLILSSNDEDLKIKNQILKKIQQTSKFICFN